MKYKTLPPEEWRIIDRPDIRPRWGYYEISNHGRARHVFKDKPTKILRTYTKSGAHKGPDYKVIKLCRKELPMSRLVWTTFKGPVGKGMCIIHINGLKEDNSIWNLKAVSNRDTGMMFGYMTGSRKHGRRTVVRINRDGEILNVYRSSRAAAREYGCLCYQTILNKCNHKTKREKDKWLPDGTTFRWEDEVMK